MKFTSLSESGGYSLPACHILNLCGFHILFDCPLDLSALTIFSPITTSLYGNHDEHKTLLDRTNLIPAEPYYKTVEKLHLWNVSLIDVVLISSPMAMLGLPFLTRTQGFSAKIYATEATTRLGHFLMEDLVAMHMEFKQYYGPREEMAKTKFLQFFNNWEELEVLSPALKDILLGKDGTELGSWMPLYSAGDVRECLQKIETLRYAEEACYNGTLIIKAFSSGLEIGSCNWSLKGPKRNISYISSSVFSSGTAMNFDFHGLVGSDILIYSDFPSWNKNSCPSLVIDDCLTKSDIADTLEIYSHSLLNFDESSEEIEKLNFICSCSINSVKVGGSVLIPIGRLGIILQLLELLALHIESSNIKRNYWRTLIFYQNGYVWIDKLDKVPQMLKMLQPKLILLPHFAKPYFAPLSNSLPFLFYPENETLHIPSSKNLPEVNIATDLTHQLTFLKLKNKDLTISRLKGELVVDQGKHYLLAEKHAMSSEIMNRGKVDIDNLLLALEKIGVKGSMEKVKNDDGCGSNVLLVFEPSKALIQVKKTSIVISTGDKSLASLISDAVHILLNDI